MNLLLLICVLAGSTMIVTTTSAFVTPSSPRIQRNTNYNNNQHKQPRKTSSLASSSSTTFELQVDLPPSNSGLQAYMKIQPLLSVPSELVVVRYKIPFGLDVAPKKGLAVCTKDGPGGEKVNDILRYTSQWSLGLPQGSGIATTAASFAGGVSWQCSMFDVAKAKVWEQVVQALTSNTVARTDEVLLIFERASDGNTPPELL